MNTILRGLLGLVTGNLPGLIMSLAIDALKAMILKIKWNIVVERFVSRAITIGLRWLEKRYSNRLLVATVDSILEQLSSPDVGLPRVKEQDVKIQRKTTPRKREN
ncbi:hypothetical protein V6238_12100 [Marinomonas arenicola]|uniref:hypothetical protein n=1 Tax=Marinomonas arenicola TaxID=569601 RepID=UPI00311E0C31